MSRQGILVVISGFSGAGKGTLMKALVERYDQYALSVSATTRPPREGEVEGKEYFFVSQERFQAMVEQDQLIEYARYVDHDYGTPKDYVMKQLNAGKDVILEIEIQGALKVKERFPDALLLFVMPPSAEELKRRLVNRGTESQAIVEARLKRACEEAVGIEAYDYLVVNDQIDTCTEKLHRLIQTHHDLAQLQRDKVLNRLDFIEEVRKGLRQL